MKNIRSIFIAVCGLFAVTLAAMAVFKLVTADYEKRPSHTNLASEFSRIHEVMGGSSIEQIEKPALRGITAPIALGGRDRKELADRFFDIAEANGWRKVSQPSVEAKFCKDRLSLTLEMIDDPVRPRMEYGIFWTADRASFLYCGT